MRIAGRRRDLLLRYLDTQERAWDYLAMGVEMVWVIDPRSRTGRMCKGDVRQEVRTLRVPGSPIYVDLDETLSAHGGRAR